MSFLNIDVFVEWTVRVECIKVDRGEALVLAGQEETGHDSDRHIVNSSQGDGTIVDSHGEVGTKVRVARQEGDVSGHGLVC